MNEGDSPLVLTCSYHSANQASFLCQNLYDMYKKEEFCDVIVNVGVQKIKAHKVVLAAFSSYFRNLFHRYTHKGHGPQEVTLQSLNEEAVKALIGFCYTSDVIVCSRYAENLLAVATVLDVPEVVRLCSTFLTAQQTFHPMVLEQQEEKAAKTSLFWEQVGSVRDLSVMKNNDLPPSQNTTSSETAPHPTKHPDSSPFHGNRFSKESSVSKPPVGSVQPLQLTTKHRLEDKKVNDNSALRSYLVSRDRSSDQTTGLQNPVSCTKTSEVTTSLTSTVDLTVSSVSCSTGSDASLTNVNLLNRKDGMSLGPENPLQRIFQMYGLGPLEDDGPQTNRSIESINNATISTDILHSDTDGHRSVEQKFETDYMTKPCDPHPSLHDLYAQIKQEVMHNPCDVHPQEPFDLTTVQSEGSPDDVVMVKSEATHDGYDDSYKKLPDENPGRMHDLWDPETAHSNNTSSLPCNVEMDQKLLLHLPSQLASNLCPLCQRTFISYRHMRKHLQTHYNQYIVNSVTGKSQLIEADGSLVHPSSSVSSSSISSLHTSVPCPTCGQMFKDSKSLSFHKRTHTKRYFCSLCGKRFSHAGNLHRHRRTHTGEKPYSCPHCTKCFAGSSDLQVHIRGHLGEKPYKCNQCEDSFVSITQLRWHVKRMHDRVKTT